MLFIKQALVFTTLLCSALAAPHHHDDSIVDWERLNSLLDSIDSDALHNVLHAFTPKFRDGVFSKDRAAIQHVHSENPILASKIVYIAKRQNNGTTTDSTPSSTVGVRTTNSRSATTTSVAAVAPAVSSAVSEQITQTRSTPSPTTIEIAPSASSGEVPVATVSGGVVFSTEGGGVVTRTSSAVTVSFTRSTSTHLYYSTAADGQVSTSTSLIVVNAPVTETVLPTGAAGAAATSGAGLQSGADRSNSNSAFAGLVLGALGLYLGL